MQQCNAVQYSIHTYSSRCIDAASLFVPYPSRNTIGKKKEERNEGEIRRRGNKGITECKCNFRDATPPGSRAEQ